MQNSLKQFQSYSAKFLVTRIKETLIIMYLQCESKKVTP